MKIGDNISYEKDGVIYTERAESVDYTSGSPAIYRRLNRWQRMVRRVTPRRWQKSLLVHEAVPPSVAINVGQRPPAGKTLAQLEQIRAGIREILDTADEF
ncbi:hypothetical protein A5677_00470 [Mycobacterium malmoense]|uniref:Uncharacterized protein n=1 Tax=Mycobacterium malmoense TaxID=1780 RepID=A0A1B9CI49_MYCMA|nr:hypothetical protein [Mycobacterium malmoense]OCB41881.1 hypothetical protein A5677_00470 [Mycobacterium malmoense]